MRDEENISIHRLKGLEDKRVAGGGGLDLVRKGGINNVDKKKRRKKGDFFVV